MTAQTIQSPTISTCPSWCVSNDCGGDHWADPGGAAWPAVRPSAWPRDNATSLAIAPTWGECDDLDPAVACHISSSTEALDLTLDLTLAEARELARNLLRAAEAAAEDRR